MATITEVAKLAGVSVATVSRVMNGTGIVSADTKENVLKAIQELDYQPNELARNLRMNMSRTILIILPNVVNLYYAAVFSGINKRAQELGYNPLLSSSSNLDQEVVVKEAIYGKKADGAILLSIDSEDEWLSNKSINFPVVQCCEYTRTGKVPSVHVDNYEAAYEATRYLIDAGCKTIGTVSSTNRYMSTINRMNGYQAAMRDAGLAVSDKHIAYTNAEYDYFYSLQQVRELLTGPYRPDGLFCVSDSVALSAIVVAKEMGLRIPEDLKVIGFDDIFYAKMLQPHITTVAQPCELLGITAVDLFDKLMRNQELEESEIIVPYEFIIRDST